MSYEHLHLHRQRSVELQRAALEHRLARAAADRRRAQRLSRRAAALSARAAVLTRRAAATAPSGALSALTATPGR